jgi:hypothetical protein
VSIFDTHAELDRALQAVVKQQLKYSWTTPALAKNLGIAQNSVTQLGVTLKLTSKPGAASGNGAQPSQGRKTDALSLGIGVRQSAAAKISAGISLGIGISAHASLLTKLGIGLHSAKAKVSGLQRELTKYNIAAAAKASATGVLPPGQKIEQAGVNGALRALQTQLDESHAQATSAAQSEPAHPISAELQHPRVGPWECALDFDTDTPPSGKIRFELDDHEFVGTVLPGHTGVDGTRGRCRVIGGNGGLSNLVVAHSYSGGTGTRVGTIVRDILHECGEDLSDLSDHELLDKTLPRWHVAGGTAKQALTQLADAVGGAWRVLRDGTVWFGVELWPEVAPEGTVTSESWQNGHLTLASETPDMVPGTVYQGQRIEHVTHDYGTRAPDASANAGRQRRQCANGADEASPTDRLLSRIPQQGRHPKPRRHASAAAR